MDPFFIANENGKKAVVWYRLLFREPLDRCTTICTIRPNWKEMQQTFSAGAKQCHACSSTVNALRQQDSVAASVFANPVQILAFLIVTMWRIYIRDEDEERSLMR
jgi:hypothetical protein